MATELGLMAGRAWAAMTRPVTIFTRIAGAEQMPVGAALDMVQDVCGGRDEAVTALLEAGADWLQSQTQPARGAEIDTACLDIAGLVIAYIRSEGFGMADTYLGQVASVCNSTTDPRVSGRERLAANEWLGWARKAASVLSECRQVVAAAYPEAK